jgi:hypothetical protein
MIRRLRKVVHTQIMAEPAKQPEPQKGPDLDYAPGPRPKIARSGYAIWSLIFGILGGLVFFGPVVTAVILQAPSLTLIARVTRGILAICSVLAILFGSLGISQVNRGLRRGKGMAIVGLILGIIGLLAYLVILAIVR